MIVLGSEKRFRASRSAFLQYHALGGGEEPWVVDAPRRGGDAAEMAETVDFAPSTVERRKRPKWRTQEAEKTYPIISLSLDRNSHGGGCFEERNWTD
ncbi:hypothetical protein N7528_006379 [Penicillium herquei]|nr:hypothetical protein N7528_006379 [Penicillium herquei]